MKRVKAALAFVCAGLLAIAVWAGYEMEKKNPTIEKEEAPVVYSIVQYTDLFILDGAPHTKYLFVESILARRRTRGKVGKSQNTFYKSKGLCYWICNKINLL